MRNITPNPGGMERAKALLADLRRVLVTGFWLLLALLLVWTAFFTVPADSVAVVQRFGKYLSTEEPGLHFKVPFGVDKVTQVPIRRQLKLEFGYQTGNASNAHQGSREPQQEQDMVTGDLNSARVEWVVQYRIDDPRQYLFVTSDPEDTLRAAAEAVMREVVGDRSIDEVITFGRAEIEGSALPLIQKLAKQYQLGLRVDLVQLKNINPPGPVQASFNDVNNAQQEPDNGGGAKQGFHNNGSGVALLGGAGINQAGRGHQERHQPRRLIVHNDFVPHPGQHLA